jgi:hypothetical protein
MQINNINKIKIIGEITLSEKISLIGKHEEEKN